MCECVFIRMADYAVSSFFGFLFRFISDDEKEGETVVAAASEFHARRYPIHLDTRRHI